VHANPRDSRQLESAGDDGAVASIQTIHVRYDRAGGTLRVAYWCDVSSVENVAPPSVRIISDGTALRALHTPPLDVTAQRRQAIDDALCK